MTQDFYLNKTVSFKKNIDHFSEIITNTIITKQNNVQPITTSVEKILQLFFSCKEKNATVYVIGNGGSAAIASHAVIDFLNMVEMKATALIDPATTTCISNDYGYESVYEKQLNLFIQKNDVLIAISSSGQSKNIIRAVTLAKKRDANVITLSGFLENNPLRQLGDYNIWLNSKDYGQVEIGHAFILHYFTDCLRNMNCVVKKEMSTV